MTSSRKTVAGVASLLVLLLLALWWWQGGGGVQPVAAGGNAAAPPPTIPAPVSGDAGAAASAPLQRTEAELPANADTVTTANAPAPEPVPLHGRVLDSRGQPMAAVPVQLFGFDTGWSRLGAALADAQTTSDTNGAFELLAPGGETVVPMAGAGFATLRSTTFPNATAKELLVVAAPAVDLRGLVHDDRGAPIAGALVSDWAFLLDEFPTSLEHTVPPRRSEDCTATTGADGRFALSAVPLAAGVNLLFACSGYRGLQLPSLQAASGFVDVTLQKEVAGEAAVYGTVLDAQGRPIEGTELRYGWTQATQSGRDGGFRFELEARPARLLAMRPGFRPVIKERVGKDTPMPLLLEISQPCLEIHGRVVDARGAPLRDVLVNLVDPVRAGRTGSVEKLSAAWPEEGLPDAARARCDEDGAFVVGGLSDRDYTLRAWDEKTAVSVQSAPVHAGARDVLLTVPDDACVAELRGIVVDRQGRGVAGAFVASHLLADNVDDIAIVQGPSTTTGADGRFVLQKVPCRYLTVTVYGDDLVYVEFPVEDCLREREARLEVQLRCYVQVEGEVGQWVSFLDAGGGELVLKVESQGTIMSANGWTLKSATSPVLSVAETAVTMVWYRDQTELGRKAIELRPGRDNVNHLRTGR